MTGTPSGDSSSPASAADADEAAEYRRALVSLEQQSQKAFDTTVVTLAGGALGLSFAFLKDILKGQPPIRPGLILAAWILWVVTLTIVLTSYYTSALAMRKGIRQLDAGGLASRPTGGLFAHVTTVLNALALAAFIVGLLLAGFFLRANMGS